jgi:hypothetical protein
MRIAFQTRSGVTGKSTHRHLIERALWGGSSDSSFMELRGVQKLCAVVAVSLSLTCSRIIDQLTELLETAYSVLPRLVAAILPNVRPARATGSSLRCA